MHTVGDRITIADPEILVGKTDALRTYALATLLRYATILEHEWCPVNLTLTRTDEVDAAYLQCVDLGMPYTDGGIVIFKCRRI